VTVTVVTVTVVEWCHWWWYWWCDMLVTVALVGVAVV
jgi:membrane-associated protease RseP (regulator of RpoE activity)